MSTSDKEARYIRKWRPRALRGDITAMSNLAASYRILGKNQLSANWYKRAADHGDGDAKCDWAYCLQHGVGIRRNVDLAERTYRGAIASKCITAFGREEAMYHLATLLLVKETIASRRAASKLLRTANADGDYPQADALLKIMNASDIWTVCTCRRHLRPRLAKRHCPLHGPRKQVGRLT